MASGEICVMRLSICREKRSRKCWARAGMSPRRARKGGNSIVKTLMR